MKGFGDLYKSKKKKKKKTNLSREEIINQAIQFHLQGNISEATKYYQKLISQRCNDHRVFSNYGAILQNLNKLEEAEKLYRKAIALNPNFANAYCNLGNLLRDLGKLQDAELYTRKAIALNPNFANAHYNLGNLLMDLGKLQDAEKLYRKAIALNPNFADAHYNLGIILISLGKLKEAELSYLKAIEIKPDYAKGYYSLSLLKNSNKNERWKDQLFSENIFINNSQKNKVDIFFARANILHKEKRYQDSSKYLELANNLKLKLNPSNAKSFINKSRKLLIESDKKKINNNQYKSISENIFIVGMYRSGSTLVESILSMRDDVYDLGETNFLEESFIECENSTKDLNLTELYTKKVNINTELNITTNKYLYNYQYAGIIAWHMPNAKIIHCFRNPLDNILSIYRGHFDKGSEYSSSLVDCANVYLDQEKVMTEYKKRFRSNIYDLNYDLLVSKPEQEIKSLLSWLGWEWNDFYLSPHLNPRSVSTTSCVQVRSPINSKSTNGWKNYKEMLKPAIEIITQIDKYKNLIL